MKIDVYHQQYPTDFDDLPEDEQQEIAKRAHRAFLDGWHPDDPVEHVYSFEYDGVYADDIDNLLEQIYYWFNVGHDPDFGPVDEIALDYRSKNLRSLSIGDVVTVDGDAWAVRTLGWQHVGDAFTPPMPKG